MLRIGALNMMLLYMALPLLKEREISMSSKMSRLMRIVDLIQSSPGIKAKVRGVTGTQNLYWKVAQIDSEDRNLDLIYSLWLSPQCFL